jgi:iron-sulfur cluster assembly protein
VVVDPFSAPYLRGARVDYLETIQESGFKIDNPNAVSSCGCGHSFQVEDETADAAQVGGCGSGCSA